MGLTPKNANPCAVTSLHEKDRTHDTPYRNSNVSRPTRAAGIFYKCLDVLASLMFLAGSVCFLPSYAWNIPVFILGCRLFVYGSSAYCLLCVYNLSEALKNQRWRSFDALESGLFLWGSVCFLIGTIYYWPDQGHLAPYIAYMEDKVVGQEFNEGPRQSPLEPIAQIGEIVQAREIIAHISSHKMQEAIAAVHDSGGNLAMYVNSFQREFYGSVLFVVGSLFFAFGACANLLKQHTMRIWEFSNWVASLMQVSGSFFFITGSCAFLPEMGASQRIACVGSYSFVFGSLLYLLGACLRVPPMHEVSAANRPYSAEGNCVPKLPSRDGDQRLLDGTTTDTLSRKSYSTMC